MNRLTLQDTRDTYANGYLDALSDVLGVASYMGETADLYKLKELIRKALSEEKFLGVK